MESWEEASKWLERHGWGPGLIDEQKVAWDAANAPKPVEAKTAKPVEAKTTSFGKKGK